MNLKHEDLHYSDLGASLRNFNDVIKTRKQGDMGTEYWVLSAGYWLLVTEYWVLSTLGTENWVLSTGYWVLST